MTHHTHRPDVDGLRAIAVVAVMLFHAFGAFMPGGYVGVDIFFVISGYLITGILLRDMAQAEFSLLRFYQRRVRRISPALLLVLFACWLFGWFALLPTEYKELGRHTGGASVFISNFVLWKEAGYFDTASELKPLLHLWSLGVEEQFYILWPLLLWAAWRSKRLPWLIGLLLLLLASLTTSIAFSSTHRIASFYLPPARFWELMAGGLLAYGHWRGVALLHPMATYRNAASALGLLFIALAYGLFSADDVFPGWRAALPVAGAVLLIAAGQAAWVNRHLLGNRWVVAIGLISYPLYLWHWPLLVFARIITSRPLTVAESCVALALSVLLAWATYRFVEQPIRFGRYRGSLRVLAVLAALMAFLGALGLMTEKSQGLPAMRGMQEGKFRDLERLDTFRATLHPCADTARSTGLDWCYTSQPGTPQFALLGDSHADAAFPGIVAADSLHNWLLVGLSSCPPLKDVRSHRDDRSDGCVEANRNALQMILHTPSIHTVVLASLGSFYFGDTISPQFTGKESPAPWRLRGTDASEAGLEPEALYAQGLARMVSALQNAGKKVVFLLDVPELDFWPVTCIERPLALGNAAHGPCRVERTRSEHAHAALRRAVQTVRNQHPALRVYDPYPLFCDETTCRGGNDRMLFYRDTHHVSIRGSKRLGNDFIRWLETRPTAGKAPAR